MVTYYGQSVTFIFAYVQKVALKKWFAPPSIHFEKCLAPPSTQFEKCLAPPEYADLLYPSSIAWPLRSLDP